MDRKIARAHAMKLIYEWEMGGDGGEETRINLLGVEPNENETDYMNRMVSGVDTLQDTDTLVSNNGEKLQGKVVEAEGYKVK